ncbi:MAG: hypothetical protein QOE55_589 [Acidobacteriaceae bacterium]|jgi:hypothetical protein|nr:hypothetical protein [Acidobacteriaceae bacterium]
MVFFLPIGFHIFNYKSRLLHHSASMLKLSANLHGCSFERAIKAHMLSIRLTLRCWIISYMGPISSIPT